ncbi:LolA family protein [Alysiella crassa]|uniref:Lipoprotein chaperone n=1 Tax=Alysiella crassa TaxID=153491 RepID=A0A376BUX1_9NEIS|nr:outer membrane lipoprotein carrier protein LolA [Alysiella crassa]UOP06117.1 outer membrane lipoprotein carrier protein LolA [Alysiella crassa]SSY80585.1 lipoprotein chaperone [Alysiella crassa]
MFTPKLLLTVSLFASASAWALTPAELTTHLQQPNTIQGQFVQQRYLKSLPKPLQTTGQFALQKQIGLFWHVQKPLDVQLRVRPNGIAQWDKKTWRNSSQSGQAAQVKLFMAVLGGNTQELSKQFDLDVSGSLKQWTLTLRPKTTIMKQVFQNITIQGDQVVRQVELREKQGDRTVMKFTQTQINQPLSAAATNAFK